jgi:tetratricopeptide (TPR) repeat protein
VGGLTGKLWLRLKKEKQWRKWQEEDEVAAAFPMQQAALVTKMEGLEAEIARRDEAGFGGNVDALREQIAGVAGEMEALKTKQDKYEDRKQWRSSEVSVEDEEFAVKTPEQVALEKQDDIRRSRIGRDERIAKAVAAKAAGTALFKAKKWAEASEAYADGFDYVRMFDDPEDMATASEIRLSLALNLSAACHKTGEFGRAVGYASKALEVDQDNAKALYRRGQARIGTRDYAAAKADLMRAAKLAPKDKAINKAAKEAKALLTKSQAPLTDDEKADQYLQAAKDNEAIFREFAYLRSGELPLRFLSVRYTLHVSGVSYMEQTQCAIPPCVYIWRILPAEGTLVVDDASEEYINAHSELLTEHATGWMLLHCLELEMKGNTAEMRKVSPPCAVQMACTGRPYTGWSLARSRARTRSWSTSRALAARYVPVHTAAFTPRMSTQTH